MSEPDDGEGGLYSVCKECHEWVCRCDTVLFEETDDAADELAQHFINARKTQEEDVEQAEEVQVANTRYFDWEQTGMSFWIVLPLEKMRLLLRRDDSQIMMDLETLSDQLLELPGVSQVEYSGHFGAGIGLNVIKSQFPENGQQLVDKKIHEYLDKDWGELVD